ncbi:MAG: repeat-containing protein [Gemmatimonadetes bacterium]|nr:repeat-containing protein [Gemmatimonadota bacterium]
MRPTSIAALAAFLGLPASAAHSQTHATHGHDTSATLGTVHFPTACSPAVASEMDRGVALLHSFEFGGSISAFNSVLARDSTCAMADWGIALSR